jgi:hypothetical protein
MEKSSANRKLLRGIEHLKTLREETAAFEHDHAYIFDSEAKPRSAQEIEYRCFATERKPVDDSWALLAGEALQNLRSALDHVIYAAGGKRGKSMFPIFGDRCEFQVLSKPMVKGVPESVLAFVEAAQPYLQTPADPSLDPLAELRTLSNKDKHRVLSTIASAVTHEGVGTTGSAKIDWREIATDKALGSGKAQISRFIARVTEGEINDVDVQPMFSYQVRVEGRQVDNLLWIAKRVYRVVFECQEGEGLSPFAAYPI